MAWVCLKSFLKMQGVGPSLKLNCGQDYSTSLFPWDPAGGATSVLYMAGGRVIHLAAPMGHGSLRGDKATTVTSSASVYGRSDLPNSFCRTEVNMVTG